MNLMHRAWQRIGKPACEGLTDLLFPPWCLLCDQPVDVEFSDALYCTACRQRVMTPLAAACFRCGIKLPVRQDGQRQVPLVPRERTLPGCPDCRRRRWAFDRTVAVGAYDGVWRDHIYQLKRAYHWVEAYQAGKLLGQVLAECEWADDSQVLVPLPIHWRRRLSRGFNQAQRIAEGIRCHLPLPILHRALRVRRYTRKQGTLSAAARIANVQGALGLGKQGHQLKDRQVILVDDVLTTGATAHTAARLCRRAGAQRVAVAIVARAGRI